MKLRIAFFDDAGRRVEQFTGDLAEVQRRIALFVEAQGGGESGRSGRIEFSTVDD